MRDDAPRSLTTMPSAARSFFVSASRVPDSSGTFGRSISPAMPRSSSAAYPMRSALSRIVFQLQAGQPSVENAIG